MQRTHITIKQKPTSQPNTGGFPTWALSILKEKPFTTIYWLILTFGGLLTYSFLFGTGYLPDLDWENLPVLLLVVAASGLLVVGSITALLGSSGYFLCLVWPHLANKGSDAAAKITELDRSKWFFLTSCAHFFATFALLMWVAPYLPFPHANHNAPESYYIWLPMLIAVIFFILAGPCKFSRWYQLGLSGHGLQVGSRCLS